MYVLTDIFPYRFSLSLSLLGNFLSPLLSLIYTYICTSLRVFLPINSLSWKIFSLFSFSPYIYIYMYIFTYMFLKEFSLSLSLSLSLLENFFLSFFSFFSLIYTYICTYLLICFSRVSFFFLFFLSLRFFLLFSPYI